MVKIRRVKRYVSNHLMHFLILVMKFFFYGIIALIPILLILWLFNLFWGGEVISLKGMLELVLGRIFSGVEISDWIIGITLFLIIIGIGILSPLVSKRIYSWIGGLLQRLLRGRMEEQYQGTVLYEPFRKGYFRVGVVTGYLKGTEHLKGGKVLKVFLPSVPIPLTGFAPDLVQEKDVIYTNLPADEVINTYTSGGILAPKRIPELVAELERRETELSEKDKQRLLKAAK